MVIMGFYVTQGNVYYEGAQQDPSDTPVPQKPDGLHDWINGEWVKGDDTPQPITQFVIADEETGAPTKITIRNGEIIAEAL